MASMGGVFWFFCLAVCIHLGSATYVAINSGGPDYQQNTSTTAPPVLNSTIPGSLVFQVDRFFTGVDTRVNNFTGQAVNKTSDPALYISDREGKLVVYSVNIPAGIYTVSLYFAELDPLYQGNGLRAFDVIVQDQLALPRFDIFNVSGGPNTAYVATVPAFVDASQLLTIKLRAITGRAKINAVLVNNGSAAGQLRGIDARPPPLKTTAINAGGGAIGNETGTGPCSADSFFVGGQAVNVSGVGGIGGESAVFATARTGPFFQYFLNLPAGDYAISLFFADANSTAAGQRTSDVFFDGVPVLSALDVFYTSGTNALILTKAATVVSNLLTISFVGLNNTLASVSAIKVAPINTNGTLSALPIDIGSAVPTLSETGVLYRADNSSYYLPGGGGNVTNAPPGTNFTLGGLPGNASAYTPALFNTARVGTINMSVPVPNGDYLVDLEFADVSSTSAGQRLFSLAVNGQMVSTGVDLAVIPGLYGNSGGNGSAGTAVRDVVGGNGTSTRGVIVKLQVPANVTSGNLTLALAPVSGAPPFLSALYIHPDVPNRAYVTPVAANRAQAPAGAPAIVLTSTSTQTPLPTPTPPPTSTPTPTPTPTPTSPPPTAAAPAQAPATSSPTPTPTNAAPEPAPSSASPTPTPTPASSPASAPSAAASVASTNAAGTCASNGGSQGIDCNGGCPTYGAANSVAVNCGSANAYTSTCGVQFLADVIACDPGDAIPSGAPYCRTNIKGPGGGFSYPTDRSIAGTADPTIFQSERIGFNTYKFRVENGLYGVAAYFAETSSDDPSLSVNSEGLRRFTLIFNDDSNSPISNVDPFKLAGNQKFVACPVQTAQIQVNNGVLKVQLFPTGFRDAPAIKALWVHKIG